MTRLFLSAGESSGDLHGSYLVRALKELDPNIQCVGLGGARMHAAGMTLRYDLAGRAIMGFTEVLRSFPFIRRLFLDTVQHLRTTRPDAVVLIDYPGFNLRLAREAKKLGLTVIYYISPQVWAWKRGRIRHIAQTVDKMLVILPFEEALYRDAGVPCAYVGHPLLDHVNETAIEGIYEGQSVVGLMPGSRKQEIERILPVMLAVAQGIRDKHPDICFVVPCVDSEREQQVRRIAGGFPLETLVNRLHELLHSARFCMVASGTATVETALFGVPMVILYRVTEPTYRLARLLVRVDHIGMVNILAGRRIVPEFVQHDAQPEAILPVALGLITDTPARQSMVTALRELRAKLGEGGASMHAAREILAVLKQGIHG